MENWLIKAPKVELHCHLDGSLPLDVVRKLADDRGIAIPKSDEELKNLLQVHPDCTSLKEYLEKFDLPGRCLQDGEALEYAAYELVRRAAAEGVIYMEVRFAPLKHVEGSLNADQAVEHVVAGLLRGGRDFNVYAAAILCGMRHECAEDNKVLVGLAKKYQGCGVCGVDIAGNEADFPPNVQAGFLREAVRAGIALTVHAGECGSEENIRDAIELGAARIGHGIAMKSPDLMQLIKDRGIGIEMCPTSNFQTKAVDCAADYPFIPFYAAGLPISINTDNRTVSGTTITAEFDFLMKQYGIKKADVQKLTENAAKMAFAPEQIKEQLYGKITDYYQREV